MTRAHALLDHRERDGVDGFLTITGGKLTTYPADGRGDRRRDRAASSASDAPVHDRDRGRAAGLRGPRALPTRRRGSSAARRRLLDDQLDLRVRARSRAGASRRRCASAARRTSTTSAGSCASGWGRARAGSASTARPGSCTASSGSTASRPTSSLRRLPAGALEGRMADPLRRPAAPGAPGRLDLPGPARRGAPAGMTRPAGPRLYDVARHRRRARRADAARAAGRGRRAGHACSPRASAPRTSAPGTIDVLGYAPRAGVERPRRGCSESA